jgi:hypothetical protein
MVRPRFREPKLDQVARNSPRSLNCGDHLADVAATQERFPFTSSALLDCFYRPVFVPAHATTLARLRWL